MMVDVNGSSTYCCLTPSPFSRCCMGVVCILHVASLLSFYHQCFERVVTESPNLSTDGIIFIHIFRGNAKVLYTVVLIHPLLILELAHLENVQKICFPWTQACCILLLLRK